MKLQPNFSWQAYQDENEKKQFQYQLQQEHIVVANSVNATIDDESYFLRERQTSFTWIDGRAIYTKTLTGVIVGSAVTTYPLGATIRTLVSLSGTFQDAVPMSLNGFPLPYVNPAANNAEIGIYTDTSNVYLNVFDNTWAGYTFYVTVQYTKN